jgi:hypothetical protein
MRRLSVGLAVELWVGVVLAQPAPRAVLCESHAGARPAQADEWLAALAEGLDAPAPLAGATLDQMIAARLSRPAGVADYPLEKLVRDEARDGQREVVQARFAAAALRIERLRALAEQHAATVAANPRIRKSLFEGALAMVKALVRLRRQSDAESLALDIARSFPDYPVTERDCGPEVAQFLAEVRRRPRPTYAIQIETTPAAAAVFLNERYVGTSPVRIQDALPGRYRVMARAGEAQSRVHAVTVHEESAEVRIDLAFDRALDAAGFRFLDEAERARREPAYAARLARAVGAAEVIAVGLGGLADRPLWIATSYDVESGGVRRAAAVALAPGRPPRARFVALGRFLRAGTPAEGLMVMRAPPAPAGGAPLGSLDVEARAPTSLRPWAYAGLGVGLALAAVGGYFLYLDGRPDCDLGGGQLQCPSSHRTLLAGATMVGGGAALAVGATALWLIDAHRARVRLGATVGPGGTAVWAVGSF